MRIITSIIIFGILLSYAPIISIEDCPETNHFGKMSLDCGSLFHCPFILNIDFSVNFYLPLKGSVVLSNHLPHYKLVPRSIFHPPELQKERY